MKKLFYSLIILILSSFFLATPSLAIIKTVGEMMVSYDEPLFSSSTIWYPGLTLKNIIKVKNIGKTTKSLGIRTINTFQTGKLAEALIFKVDENGNKTLKDFWDMKNELKITNLNPNKTKTINLTIYAPKNLSNKYQNKEARFDIIIGFLGSTQFEAKVLGATTKSDNKILIYIFLIVLIFLLIIIFIISPTFKKFLSKSTFFHKFF